MSPFAVGNLHARSPRPFTARTATGEPAPKSVTAGAAPPKIVQSPPASDAMRAEIINAAAAGVPGCSAETRNPPLARRSVKEAGRWAGQTGKNRSAPSLDCAWQGDSR